MRTFQVVCFILSIGIGISSYSQSPEQQKQIEEAQRQVEEAQKKAMEMMQNNPQFQEAMKMMEGAEDEMKQERMRVQLENEKKQKDAANDHLEEFYWRNKVASNTQGVFNDWRWGTVEIAYYAGDGKPGPDGKFPYVDYVVIGRVTDSGVVQLDLPPEVQTNRTIKTGLFPQMHEILNDEVAFSDPNTPFLWYGYRLAVLQRNDVLGHLSIGNSERTTHNLASPADLKYGDEGYLLYWVYSAKPCQATFDKKDLENSVNEGETTKVIDQFASGNMDFKAGWNLVKIEVNGYYNVGNRTRWKFKTYMTVDSMPSDGRYYFKYE